MRVELHPYPKFADHFQSLEKGQRAALGSLLRKLKMDPYDPAFLSAELDDDGQYAMEFQPSWFLFWKFIDTSYTGSLKVRGDDLVTIEIEAIQYRRQRT